MNTVDYYIGYSSDRIIRHKASSGGIGSQLIKYLLSTEEYGTSMTFVFNSIKSAYEPKLIYSYDEYNNCGSIYQDTDNISFIRENLNNIRDGIVVTCMPCQVRAIRSILQRNKIKSFIISFCCSGQTTVKGTWLYYNFLGIKRENVSNIQYRGNGWPSGIQIHLSNGSIIKKDNYTYPWNIIHSSQLYRPLRCLTCTFKTVPFSDINLADPWLAEYESDKEGNSIIIANTEESKRVINYLVDQKIIICKEVDQATYVRSQKGTIEEKLRVKEHPYFTKMLKLMSTSNFYLGIVSSNPSMLIMHNRIIRIIKKHLL